MRILKRNQCARRVVSWRIIEAAWEADRRDDGGAKLACLLGGHGPISVSVVVGGGGDQPDF